MNPLIECGVITEKQSGVNFMYVLNDNKDFLITEYKVLQNQSDSNFIPCMKILYNGKTALYYKTDICRTLQEILPNLDSNSFMNVVANLLRTIIEVKNNGFLSCQNIDLSFDKIFVNGSNLNVNLVYVPIQRHAYADYIAFETKLRTKLIETIRQNPSLQSPSTASLERNLSDSTMSITTLAGYVRGGEPTQGRPVSSSASVQQMKLIALRAPVRFELVVDQNEYIIGKKAGAVNGVISFNSAISRVHCKIIQNEFGYKIEDLGSANGTYVNRQKLIAHKAVPIKNGDIVRLANSDFQVLIQ